MKSKFSIAMSLAVILAMLLTSLVLADTVSSDVDFVATGDQTLINLGTFAPSEVVNTSTSFQLVCSGKNHADQGNTVFVNYFSSTVPAGSLTAGNTSIGPIPGSWADDSGDCITPAPIFNDNGNSAVTITAPAAAGTYDYVVTYKVCQSNDATQCGGIDPNDVSGSIPAVTFRLTVSAPVKTTPTITFDPAPTPTYLGGNFTVNATTTNTDSSALTYSYMSGPCAFVSGATFSSSGAGTCVVQASGAATTNFNAASAQQSITIAKANQTISFGALSDKTYGDTDFTVSATATSGLAVSFAASGDCSISSNTVHITGAGSCTITASQAGNSNFNAATNVSQSFNIAKAAASVTLGTLNFTYDGSPKATSASPNPSGLAVDITYGGSATAPTNAGDYAVVATINDANYAGSTSGTLHIAKASSSTLVTFEPGPYVYRGTAFTATAVATGPGGLSVPVAIVYSGDCTNVSVTDGCTATANFPGDQNHEISSDAKSITITKANANVDVSGYTGTYDGSAHGATGTAIGVLGEDLSGSLNLGASYTNVPGGPANWSFAGGTNYNNASGSVAIVINKANATINVSGYTGTYDGSAHGATGTAFGVLNEDLSAGLNLGASFTDVPGGTANWSFAGGTNYNNATGTASITINKAKLTVTADDTTIVFGQTLPTFTFQYSGFVNGETSAVIDAAPTCGVGSIPMYGSYPIVCSGGSDNNYAFDFVDGTLTVQAWTFGGFYQPVDLDKLNVAKNGSTVPLKFRVFAGTTELKNTNVILGTFIQKLTCGTGLAVDDIENYATGGTSLRYDTTGGQFIFNWQTPKIANNCYKVILTTADGSSISADFRLK